MVSFTAASRFKSDSTLCPAGGGGGHFFRGAFCLNVRTGTCCQLMFFAIKPLYIKLLAGSRKQPSV